MGATPLPRDLTAYLEAQSEARCQRVRAVIDLILGAFPEAAASMDYKMPTFKTGEGWMSVASQKRYVSVYTCSPEKIAPYLDQYPDTRCGKGCLNFRDSDEIDEGVLKRVIEKALAPDSPSPKK